MVERASPFAAEVEGSKAGIAVSAVPRGSLWQVACWPERFPAVEKRLSKALGIDAPAPGSVAVAGDGRLLVRVEPLKWWVLGDDGAECPHQPDAKDGAWLDMSHDQAAVQVTGENAAELLKRMVSVDLRKDAFPDLSFASTTVHHMFLKVLRQDQGESPSYRLMVMRSYADDLREMVAHHLHRFG
ncbi:MAG: hypothetical protein AAF479_08820 [Pseudomonadota bacterium]